jgi:hypothetical protein
MRWFVQSILVLCLVSQAFADHAALRHDEFNTNPINSAGQPGASFATQMREYLEHEIPQHLGRLAGRMVWSGGIHGTAGGLVSGAFATEAFVPERVNQTSTAITYVAAATDTCWTIVSSDNDGIVGWTRVGTTAYYYQCEGDGTPNEPALPANSAWLLRANIVASAINSVVDLRGTNVTRGLVFNATDNIPGFVGDGTDETAAYTTATALLNGATRIGAAARLFFPTGTYNGSSASPLIAYTGAGGITIECASAVNTTLRQSGAGDFFDAANTANNIIIRNCTISGNNAAARAIDTNNCQECIIEGNQITGFLNHAIDLRGVTNLHNLIQNNRISAGVGSLAAGRGANIRAGNANRVVNNYFNIGNNSNRYDTALDVRGCGGCNSIGNIFDGTPTAIQTTTPFASYNDWFDTTSGGVVSITTAINHQANNGILILHPVNITLNAHITAAGIDPQYITFTPYDGGRQQLGGTYTGYMGSPSLGWLWNIGNLGATNFTSTLAGPAGAMNIRLGTLTPDGTQQTRLVSIGPTTLGTNAGTSPTGAMLYLEGGTSSGPGTITNGATLHIENAVSGGNFTNPRSLFVAAGVVEFRGDVRVAQTGISLENDTDGSSNPPAGFVRLYVDEFTNRVGGAGADCTLVARLSSGTEIVVATLVTDGACP